MPFEPQHLIELLTTYGLKVIGGVAVLVIGYLVAGFAARAVARAADRSERLAPSLRSLLAKLTRVAILVITLIAVLNQFGVQTASLIAMVGAAGIAIGLALQGTLSNVAAGVMLLVLRPFRAGDRIELGGETLVVDQIGLFTTETHTLDNVYTMLPNGGVWGAAIKNFSRNPTRRIDLVFGIGYGDDMGRAVEIIREVLAADSRVLADPEPLVAVSELADSSVNLIARPWTRSDDYFATRLDLTRRVKERFDEVGISIPFPQRDVHLYRTGGGAAAG